jgi:hypothetical protein
MPRPNAPARRGPSLTTTAAAAYLGRAVGTLQKWRRTGDGPDCTRDDKGHWHYLIAELDRFNAGVPARRRRNGNGDGAEP